MSWPTEDIAGDASLGLALCRLAMGLDELYRGTRRGAAQHEAALAAEGLVPVDLWRGAPLQLADWAAAADSLAALQSYTVPTWRTRFGAPSWRTRSSHCRRLLAGRPARTDCRFASGRHVCWVCPSSQFLRRHSRHVARGHDCARLAEPVLEWERAERGAARRRCRASSRSYAAEARERTQRTDWRVSERPLMRLELVHDVPYTGYCDYLSNTMRLNADQPFTAQRLKLLVLHEAYPGHDYHLWRRELEVRDRPPTAGQPAGDYQHAVESAVRRHRRQRSPVSGLAGTR